MKNTKALINKKKGIEITVGTYLTNKDEAFKIPIAILIFLNKQAKINNDIPDNTSKEIPNANKVSLFYKPSGKSDLDPCSA